MPRLSIQSDLGITNQIQYSTNLSQAGWTVLTNLVASWGYQVTPSTRSKQGNNQETARFPLRQFNGGAFGQFHILGVTAHVSHSEF